MNRAVDIEVKDDTPENDSDWGFNPSRAGMAIETKIGMGIVVLLMATFGMVVWQKVSHRKTLDIASTGGEISVFDGQTNSESQDDNLQPPLNSAGDEELFFGPQTEPQTDQFADRDTVDTRGPLAPSYERDQFAGDRFAGDQFAGDRDQLAGDQFAGDQLVGEQLAGDQFAGDQFAGDQFAGDQFAGDRVAGGQLGDDQFARDDFSTPLDDRSMVPDDSSPFERQPQPDRRFDIDNGQTMNPLDSRFNVESTDTAFDVTDAGGTREDRFASDDDVGFRRGSSADRMTSSATSGAGAIGNQPSFDNEPSFENETSFGDSTSFDSVELRATATAPADSGQGTWPPEAGRLEPAFDADAAVATNDVAMESLDLRSGREDAADPFGDAQSYSRGSSAVDSDRFSPPVDRSTKLDEMEFDRGVPRKDRFEPLPANDAELAQNDLLFSDTLRDEPFDDRPTNSPRDFSGEFDRERDANIEPDLQRDEIDRGEGRAFLVGDLDAEPRELPDEFPPMDEPVRQRRLFREPMESSRAPEPEPIEDQEFDNRRFEANQFSRSTPPNSGLDFRDDRDDRESFPLRDPVRSSPIDLSFDDEPAARPQSPRAFDSQPGIGQVYVVQENDNFWSISTNVYGTPRYYEALRRVNAERITDPRRMRPGTEVLIPDASQLELADPELVRAASYSRASQVGPPPGGPAGFFIARDGTPMFRVGKDHTLMGIAESHLGRRSRWIQIYQMNRDILNNPHVLKSGFVLLLPADASRVEVVNRR